MTFQTIITGCAVVGGVVSNVFLVIGTMHGSAAARGCSRKGVITGDY